MDGFSIEKRQLTGAQMAALLLAVAIVYASSFWPSQAILGAGLEWLGNPDNEGFKGLFLPHLLLYSTFTALVAALAWVGFVRAKVLPAPSFGNARQSLVIGTIAGIVALAISLLLVWWVFPPGSIGFVEPVPWKIAGNLFSNFYEEFLFRGFILVALAAIFGFWPAAIIASVMWGVQHTQYPLVLQAMIALTGVLFCWTVRRCKSLLPAYTGHMVLDIIGDSLIG